MTGAFPLTGERRGARCLVSPLRGRRAVNGGLWPECDERVTDCESRIEVRIRDVLAGCRLPHCDDVHRVLGLWQRVPSECPASGLVAFIVGDLEPQVQLLGVHHGIEERLVTPGESSSDTIRWPPIEYGDTT